MARLKTGETFAWLVFEVKVSVPERGLGGVVVYVVFLQVLDGPALLVLGRFQCPRPMDSHFFLCVQVLQVTDVGLLAGFYSFDAQLPAECFEPIACLPKALHQRPQFIGEVVCHFADDVLRQVP
ncbi:hypothetical protein D3C77_635920 [compost metagenome]